MVRSHPRQTLSNNTRPPIGVSTYKGGSKGLVSSPNAVTNDAAINECEAPVSTSTLAHELKTKNVTRITNGSDGEAEVATMNTLPCCNPVPCCPPTLGVEDPAREVDVPEVDNANKASGL